ncbi:transcription factor IIIB 90 kDa subunit-like [Gigantopelta aegis]|uniref:transcription factor IIIB 90 kDa subunit-like n=1 Tax=Gigantopelta aegis TaxID=1735272 RepID=UPI001B889767|nr:transcription factor IIIB 90 kDa subunit-like [Gigantopelta aegis]
MSNSVCSHCGCTEIDKDTARGDAVCTNCGSVLEDQIIVSEVQFQENAAGGASVIGQYVSTDGTKSQGLGGFHHGYGKESRTLTFQNGKKRIQHLGAQIKLNQHCLDMAFNFFKMAVTRRLTRGRRSSHVIAACLYMVCRTEGTPHMLLDFSDILQVNVYTLGKTYLSISRELCINIPAVDPCLYIPRFAHKLEFGDKTHDVSMTALRLVQRMKRDWMHTGRRPSGLCGAALLVAARIHNFGRSVKDVIKVVNVAETTIRKRLNEFQATPSSQLTIEEFHTIDLEEEHDPPCYIESKKKTKHPQLLDDQNKLSELTEEVSSLKDEIEKTLEKNMKKPRGMFAAYAEMASNHEDDAEEEEEDVPLITNEKDATVLIEQEILTKLTREELENCDSVAPSRTSSPCPTTDSKADVLKSEKSDSYLINFFRPTAASLGIKEVVEITKDKNNDTSGNDEIDLTDIDDAELDRFILNEDEVKIKTDVWMKANEDYLKHLKEKEERKAQEEAEAASKPEKKKKKSYKKRQPMGEASTAREAVAMLLHEKKLSNKIDYDVLNNLNYKASAAFESPAKMAALDTPVVCPEKVKIEQKPILNRFKKPRLHIDIKKETTQEPSSKKVKFEIEPSISTPEVLVESGPVQYDAKVEDAMDDETAEDYFEEEEEEEVNISAAKLFGHEPVADYDDYPDDYYIDDD